MLAIGAAAIALAAVAYFFGYFDSDKAAGAKACQQELTKDGRRSLEQTLLEHRPYFAAGADLHAMMGRMCRHGLKGQ